MVAVTPLCLILITVVCCVTIFAVWIELINWRKVESDLWLGCLKCSTFSSYLIKLEYSLILEDCSRCSWVTLCIDRNDSEVVRIAIDVPVNIKNAIYELLSSNSLK